MTRLIRLAVVLGVVFSAMVLGGCPPNAQGPSVAPGSPFALPPQAEANPTSPLRQPENALIAKKGEVLGQMTHSDLVCEYVADEDWIRYGNEFDNPKIRYRVILPGIPSEIRQHLSPDYLDGGRRYLCDGWIAIIEQTSGAKDVRIIDWLPKEANGQYLGITWKNTPSDGPILSSKE